ncbi:MAG: hypothetical protein GXO47_10330 [Chlorobi bacterium]|nr:hypothetical protein [Chlorobiota bacterium]
MCKLRSLLLSSLFIVFMTGCVNDTDDVDLLYMDAAVITHYGSSFFITTDAGLKLLAENIPFKDVFEESIRVLIKYYLLDVAGENKEYDYLVYVTEIKEIDTKDIILINDENRDTLGSASCDFIDVWITQDYLTVNFSFFMGTKIHNFYLTYDEKEQAGDDTIVLTFRHQDNNDIPAQKLTGYVSFKLNSLKIPGKNKIEIIFKGKGFNDFEYEKNMIYSY